MVAKKMWHVYCRGNSVPNDHFLEALRQFLKKELHVTEDDVAELLSAENVVALLATFDADESGKVG